ncbi:MAG: DNA replication/repair protein RecF [Acidimicrobiales bacterium]
MTELRPPVTAEPTRVTRLAARQFRNLANVELWPSLSGLTVVQGDNGAGKTSLLEALAYCSVLKSFRGVQRESLVGQGAASSMLTCDLLQGVRRVEIDVKIEPGRRDQVTLNKQRVSSTRELLEVLRTTLFTPDDLELIKGPPGGRRDLLDDAIEATSPRLSAERASFEKILRQRNALLRQLNGRLPADAVLTLDVWDERFAATGERVAEAREQLVKALIPYSQAAWSELAPSTGPLLLRYARSFPGGLADVVARQRQEDIRRQVTTAGPQRDELEITAGGLDARTRLSQGRQRCVALALRLGIHRYVSDITGAIPVLLLDDAFSELDHKTAQALVSELPSGQAILTTAGDLPAGASPELVVRINRGVVAT